MKIFLSHQIKDWDESTILNEPISSVLLMQRAAERACREIEKILSPQKKISLICGTGNNGGDGLVLARLLHEKNYHISLCIVGNVVKGSEDFKHQFKKLNLPYINITEAADLSKLIQNEVFIDALIGTGLNRPVNGIAQLVIEKINSFKSFVISIDVPSGMNIDAFSIPEVCIQSDYTLTFQGYKLPFFLEGNSKFTGEVRVIDIGLNTNFYVKTSSDYWYLDKRLISQYSIPREESSDKIEFGHTLIIGSCKGMAGASIFAAMAANKIGSGLCSILTDEDNRLIFQTKIPEVMCKDLDTFDYDKDLGRYTSILIGPGMGTHEASTQIVEKVLKTKVPLILDADALNIIAKKKWQEKIPKGSILTPHKREFERLFPDVNYFDLPSIQEIAKKLGSILILKGRFTRIFDPSGRVYFNTTGHACLAKAGSGDVLSGMIAGSVSRYGNHLSAALLSCYLHGLSAEIYLEDNFEECLRPQDLVEEMPKAYRRIFRR